MNESGQGFLYMCFDTVDYSSTYIDRYVNMMELSLRLKVVTHVTLLMRQSYLLPFHALVDNLSMSDTECRCNAYHVADIIAANFMEARTNNKTHRRVISTSITRCKSVA
jgi:hypothetical protein